MIALLCVGIVLALCGRVWTPGQAVERAVHVVRGRHKDPS